MALMRPVNLFILLLFSVMANQASAWWWSSDKEDELVNP